MKPMLRVRHAASCASDICDTWAPPIESWPVSGLSRPAIRFRSVVLPEPEGPMMPRNSPSATSRSRFFRTVIFSPPRVNDFVTLWMCRIALLMRDLPLPVVKRHPRAHVGAQELPRLPGRDVDLHPHRDRRLGPVRRRHDPRHHAVVE